MSNNHTNHLHMIPANWGSYEDDDATAHPPTAPRIHSYHHGIIREQSNHLMNPEIGRSRSNSDTRIHSNSYGGWPSQPPRPIPFRPHVDQGPWRSFEDRVRTGPYGLNRFPSHPFSPVRIIFLDNEISPEVVDPNLRQFIQESPRRIRGEWNRNLSSSTDDESNLTRDEQNKAVNKLKKQVYNPYPKNKNNWSLYYRDSKLEHQDDDGKSCAICLEDFEPREEVVTTPCKHMFHEECIVRWVKSNGQCPVCRHAIGEKKKAQTQAVNSTNSNSSNDLVSLIRAMEEAFQWVNVPR